MRFVISWNSHGSFTDKGGTCTTYTDLRKIAESAFGLYKIYEGQSALHEAYGGKPTIGSSGLQCNARS